MGNNTYLMILIVLVGSTAIGLMFSMALQNFKNLKRGFTYVVLLSLLVTPAGTWFVSILYKMKESLSALKSKTS